MKLLLKKKSVYNVIECLKKHGIHCLPCSYINDVRFVTVAGTTSYSFQSDVIKRPFCQGTKHNSWLYSSCYGNISTLSSHL